MYRTKASAGASRRINYHETSDSSETTDDPENYLFPCEEPMKVIRGSAGRSRKSYTSDHDYEPSKQCTKKQPSRVIKKKTTKKSASRSRASNSGNSVILLDSDEESDFTSKQKNTIKEKLTGFFEALDSDDEKIENKTVAINKPQEKAKDFYVIESDDEFPFEIIAQAIEKEKSDRCEEKKKDLAECLDEFLTNTEDLLKCGTTEKPKTKLPDISLDELKKKTDSIMEEFTACNIAIDAVLGKPKIQDPTAPGKEAITCPVCFDPLGGRVQAMATVCGHLFCEPCLKGVINTKKQCPSCRKRLTSKKYHPIYI